MKFYRWFSILFSAALFLYLVSFLTARPVTYRSMENFREIMEPDSMPDLREGPQYQEYVYWKAGLISEAAAIRETIFLADDPLLESDSKPEILFRNLERAFTVRLALIFVISLWSVLLVLSAYARYRQHWFSDGLTVLIHVPLAAAFMILLLTVRRNEILDYGYNPLLMIKVLTEGFFIAGSAGLIFRSILPRSRRETGEMIPFMAHLMTDRTSVTKAARSGLKIAWHIALIGFISLAAANAVLLPLYIVQLGFPALYSALLVTALILLAVFYINAYTKVSRDSGGMNAADYLSGAAFLGYRFLMNSFVIASFAVAVGLILAMIIISALVNIGILQTIQILEAPKHL